VIFTLSALERPSQAQDLTNIVSETRVRMQAVDRRDWWAWASASAVMLLLIGFTLVLIRLGDAEGTDVFLRLDREQAVRGLLGMILLFIVHSFHQQIRIRTLRRELSGKMERLFSAEFRAEDYQKLSMLDFLTGLHNRRFMERHLEVEIGRAQRLSQPLTLMALDLDHFKEINDTFGHAAGDQVLKHFAERLRKAIRGSDIAVRMGGDEFLVLLPECTPDRAELLVPRLRDLRVEYAGRTIAVQFSVGYAGYAPNTSPPEAPHELLERADQALYASKRGQRAAC
jgi:two-component system, cell cycle response regulator